jgi:predicted DNA binding protein
VRGGVKVLKLHIKLCPTIGALSRQGSYLGYRVSDNSVYHLFQLKGDVKLDKGHYEGSHTRIFLNKRTRLVVLCSGACIIKMLLESFHVISLRIYEDRIVAVVAVETNRVENSLKGLEGSLLSVEELEPSEISLTKSDIETLVSLKSLGLLDYPKRIRLEDLARISGRSKSTISYRLRKALRKIVESSV